MRAGGCLRQGAGAVAGAGAGAMAQRMVRVASPPAPRTTVRSASGRDGRPSSRRVQRGSWAMAADGEQQVRRTGGRGQLGMPDQEADGLPRVVGAAQLGPVGIQRLPQLGLGPRRVEDTEPLGDDGGLGDVLVPAGLVERRGAVHLVRAQEAVDLRDVHPLQQVRVGGARRCCRPAWCR